MTIEVTSSPDIIVSVTGPNSITATVVRGLPGPKGDKGDKGDQGDQGIQGLQGLQGIQGIQGIQGLKGDKGDQGDTGLPGENGLDGENGPNDVSSATTTPFDGLIGGNGAICYELTPETARGFLELDVGSGVTFDTLTLVSNLVVGDQTTLYLETADTLAAGQIWSNGGLIVDGNFDEADARTALDVYSKSETDAIAGSGGLGPGELPVRYDATQPEVDCLWVSPAGQMVLITGS